MTAPPKDGPPKPRRKPVNRALGADPLDRIAFPDPSQASELTTEKPTRNTPMTKTAPPAENDRTSWQTHSMTDAMNFLSGPVMIADADCTIQFVNESAYKMFEAIEADIQRDLPHFRARDVLGKSIDVFHKNPAYQRRIMDGMVAPHDGRFSVGGKHLGFRATPVLDTSGKMSCVYVEWQDRTADVEEQQRFADLVKAIGEMSEAHENGMISHFIALDNFSGELRSVAEGANKMVGGHIATKKKILACMTELANGNLDAPIEQFSGERYFINDAVEAIRTAMKNVRAEVDKLTERTRAMSEAHADGIISHYIDTSDMTPEFAFVARGTNSMVQGHIETKKKILACVGEFAKGNFDAPIEKFSGERFFINDTIEEIRTAFKKVTGEIERFCVALDDGNLAIKIDRDGFTGDYRKIVDTMEDSLVSLNKTITTASQQVAQVAITVEQMSQSSQSLATNSQIASSSVDEVSSSAEQTNVQVKANATSADNAAKLVGSTVVVANDGNQKITEMVEAMEGIRVSSQDIAKIIKVIDEIAFQTNLLALNAAVEAARAGQHGRGFAVVAQEVRNLAGRSAKAARETSELIEDASTRVQSGVRIAGEARESFTRIANDIEEVQTIVRDIAVASDEQARGVTQINTAIGDVAKAALATSQQADELAASAAEMQSATEVMRRDFDRFNLREIIAQRTEPFGLADMSPEMMAQLRAMFAAEMTNRAAAPVAPSRVPNGKAHASGIDQDERGYANF